LVGKPQKSKHKNPMVLVILKDLKEEEEEGRRSNAFHERIDPKKI
jgi:hypothetical protein